MDRFIFSLGIANIGKKSAKQLADTFKSLENLQNASVDDLLNIDDFGDIMANAVYEFFHNEANAQLVKTLLEKGIQLQFKEQAQGVLTGYNICLTGAISIPRGKAKELILQNGGTRSDNVTKSVNVVVVGEDAGSKLEKAKKLGIELWTEEEFMKKIEK